MTVPRQLQLTLAMLALLLIAPACSAIPRSTRAPLRALPPHHLRIEHLSVDTHPDLVVDTPRPHFSWQLQDETSPSGSPVRALLQSSYQLQILVQFPDGSYSLGPHTADTGVVHSNQSTQVHHPMRLLPNRRYLLRVRCWSNTGQQSDWSSASFRTSMLDTWQAVPALWIGSRDIPMHQVKKDFVLPNTAASITSATVQYSGIGYSTLYINNAVVDPTRKLDPGWTTFERRTLYVSLDVAPHLTPGANCIAVQLGGGWYNQEQWLSQEKVEPGYGPPRLWLWLAVNYSDGSSVDVYSDTDWLGAQGPNVHDGVYMGSILDNRWLRSDWARAGVVDRTTAWINATVLPSPLQAGGLFTLQMMDPIRIPPNNLHVATSGRTSPPGVIGGDLIRQRGGVITPTPVPGGIEGQVFDLGQNLAGWCRWNATGMRGLSVMVRYSESLTLHNSAQVRTSLYIENLRNAASTDIFIFGRDNEAEVFEPPYTVHGFRYIEFRGAPHTIRASEIECYFVHSETTLVGNFTASNGVMNQIHHNTQWGQLSNLMSLPTDCPQRDERKGWMGDAALSVDESLFNFDTPNLYRNFLNLIHDVQRPDGQVPNTVPEANGGFPADPNWGTAYPTILWTLWEHYGDMQVLREHYEGAKAWIEYLRSDYEKNGIERMHYNYGDWVPPPPYPQTDRRLITAFPFLRDVQTITKIAILLNDTATHSNYTSLYSTLAYEFHSTFYRNQTTGYGDGMQASNILALALPGVVPDALVQGVVKALVTDLQAKGHLTTGIVSTAALFPVLSAHGQHDLALRLAQMTSYPSYGWMFTNPIENATTLFELWDSPMDNVDGPNMDSRNHIMFGSIDAWFYRDIAGIGLHGLDHTHIRPRMPIDSALMPELHAEVVTVRGPFAVDYVRHTTPGHRIEMTVRVPTNARATVHFEPLLAGGRCTGVTEGGTVVWTGAGGDGVYGEVSGDERVDGVGEVVEDAGTGVVSVEVGSGVYQFVASWE